jgi:polyisoprenoid-binding protein YceI
MKRSLSFVLVAAAAVVFTSTLSAQQSAKSPAKPAAPAAAPKAAAPAPAGPWTIDAAHSAANFAVKHMMVSTVRGVLGPVTGSIEWDGKNVATVKADVSIDVKKLSTGVDQRDNHLRSDDFFNADKFPVITFKSKKVIPGAKGAFKLVGDLTIRDITKEVTLDVEAPAPVVTTQGTQRTATTATTTINRLDYNLKWNQLMEAGGAIVGSDVKITVDLEVTKK